MNKIITGIIALLFTSASYGYLPLNWSPETLQSLKGGGSLDGYGIAGIELSVHGDKERKFMEDKVGLWGDFNHSFSAGLLNTNFTDYRFYGAVHFHIEAFERFGTGIKQFVYYETGKPLGERLLGELNYFIFYQFYDLDLIWSDNREYLATYIGFKSEAFNFQKEDIESYISKAFDLAEISENVVLGFYYNPDVTLVNGVSFGLELSLWNEEKIIMGTLYFDL